MTIIRTMIWVLSTLLWLTAALSCTRNGSDTDTEKGNGSDITGPADTGTGDSDGDADMDGDADGDADTDGDADGDADDTDSFDAASDEVCDDRDMDITPEPGRLMLLLDMSSSMLEGDPPKLDQAVSALTGMLEQFEGRGIEFGLDLFPDGSLDPDGKTRCGTTNQVLIDCAMNNEQNIITELEQPHITGATPIYCAMTNFTNKDYAPKYVSVSGNNILVVITDGMDNCFTDCRENTQLSSNGAFGNLAASLCEDYGIKTVTVGFGDEANPGQLNAIAAKGCTELTEYLPADNQAELQSRLEMLAGLVIQCNFSIAALGEETDPNLVNVYFDDDIVYYDEGCAKQTGWRWTDDTYSEIQFCEQSCAQLQSGEIGAVKAKFGCKTRPVV